jgi:hypothetical protein
VKTKSFGTPVVKYHFALDRAIGNTDSSQESLVFRGNIAYSPLDRPKARTGAKLSFDRYWFDMNSKRRLLRPQAHWCLFSTICTAAPARGLNSVINLRRRTGWLV